MKTINAVLALALLFGSPPLAGLQAQTRTPAGVAGSQPVPDAAAQLPAATHGGSTSGTPSAAVEGNGGSQSRQHQFGIRKGAAIFAGRDQAARRSDHSASSLQGHQRARESRHHPEERVQPDQ